MGNVQGIYSQVQYLSIRKSVFCSFNCLLSILNNVGLKGLTHYKFSDDDCLEDLSIKSFIY